MGVNDRRFLPSYEFMPNAKPGRVEVVIYPQNAAEQAMNSLPQFVDSGKECGPESASNTPPALTTATSLKGTANG